jgi:hypothetical protein
MQTEQGDSIDDTKLVGEKRRLSSVGDEAQSTKKLKVDDGVTLKRYFVLIVDILCK